MRISNKPTINEVNVLFLILSLVLLGLGSIVQQRNIHTGILITEYIIILLPNVLYLKLRGYSLKEVLGLKSITLRQGIHVFFIMIFAYPIAVFLNYIVAIFVTSISQAVPIGVPIPTNWKEYIIGLIVIAITPGICEEVMFRGTVQSAYMKLGAKKAILFTSLLFGMFHFNLLNFMGPFFLGIVLGIIRLKTGSLYGPIIGHTVNNGIAMSIGYAFSGMLENMQEITDQAPIIPQGIETIITMMVLFGWALFSFVILYLLLKSLPDTRDKSKQYSETEEKLNVEVQEIEENIHEKISWIPIIIIGGIFIFLNYRYFFLL